MSYSADARLVRDIARSIAEREAALIRCVRRFGPFGLVGTLAHLDRPSDAEEQPDPLVAAIGILDAAHAAWGKELARFAVQRKSAKARGLRRVTASEIDRYASYGWPGDAVAQDAAGPQLDQNFLRNCGMALWEPAPVNVRRRLRWAERALQPPARFDGCLLTAMIVIESMIALLIWLIFDPPSVVWYGFATTVAVALVYATFEGFRRVAKDRPRHRSTVEALVRRREALREQLHRTEQRRPGPS